MNNPKVAALVSFAVAAWLGYSLLTAQEKPSTALFTLHIVMILGAILGLIGALKKIASEREPPRE